MKPGWSSTRPLACFLPRPLPQHDLQAVFFRFLPRPLPLLACGATQNPLRGTCLACHNTNCRLFSSAAPATTQTAGVLPVLAPAAPATVTMSRHKLQFRSKNARIFWQDAWESCLCRPSSCPPQRTGQGLAKACHLCPNVFVGRPHKHFWRVPLEIRKKNGVQTESRTFAGHLWSVPGPAPRVLQKMGSKGLKNRACGARSTYFVGPFCNPVCTTNQSQRG